MQPIDVAKASYSQINLAIIYTEKPCTSGHTRENRDSLCPQCHYKMPCFYGISHLNLSIIESYFSRVWLHYVVQSAIGAYWGRQTSTPILLVTQLPQLWLIAFWMRPGLCKTEFLHKPQDNRCTFYRSL